MRKKYLELVEKGAHPAADRVCKLGKQLYILYYCVGCDTAPIAANMWYRCTFKPELLNLRDQYSGPSGHWRCAVCLERYKQGEADKYSLFVVRDSSSHFVAFIGNVSSNIKNQITLLKSYTLVTQIGEVEITVENILQALRELMKNQTTTWVVFRKSRLTVPRIPAAFKAASRMARAVIFPS